jgi:hypothetical protein
MDNHSLFSGSARRSSTFLPIATILTGSGYTYSKNKKYVEEYSIHMAYTNLVEKTRTTN